MSGVPLTDLEKATKEFFRLHWPSGAEPVPQLNPPWRLRGPLPANDQRGIYAILNEGDSVIYVGGAVSRGSGAYEGHGLGNRINSHIRRAYQEEKGGEKVSKPTEAWEKAGMAAISTLGFPPEYDYLAPAMELFLIRRLQPPENKQGKGGSFPGQGIHR